MEYRNLSFADVRLGKGFWADRCALNRTVSIDAVRDRFEETARMDATRFILRKDKPPHIFYDSDVAKWMEAVCYLYRTDKRGMAKNMKVVRDLVVRLEKHQREDGYLNSYYQMVEPEHTFTVRINHELYCAGHLLEAAIAYTEATGSERFLNVMRKNIAYIKRAFVTEKTAAFLTPGHPEIEWALIRAYRLTGEKEFLDLAGYFLDTRGRYPDKDPGYGGAIGAEEMQDTYPIADTPAVRGHAVRAMYLYTAAAAYANETGDKAFTAASERLFADLDSKTYITGGYGQTRCSEAVLGPYDLPNRTAYAESCAAIGMMFYAAEMMQRRPSALYANVIERIMYNNLLSSTSLSGDAFFYENPLEIDLAANGRELHPQNAPHALTRRQKVFDCSCCPPNINRLFASFANYIFTYGRNTLYLNQFVPCHTEEEWGKVTVSTSYPVGKSVSVRVKDCTLSEIALRLPPFVTSFTLTKNGKNAEYREKDGYLFVKAEEEFSLCFTMRYRPTLMQADARVKADAGRVAMQYGPVVYCLETVDNGENLHALRADTSARGRVEKETYGGFPVISLLGYRQKNTAALYTPAAETEEEKVTLRFIPYAAFANREECDMLVWVRK